MPEAQLTRLADALFVADPPGTWTRLCKGKFFGLPLDVRHVTLNAGILSLAAASLERRWFGEGSPLEYFIPPPGTTSVHIRITG